MKMITPALALGLMAASCAPTAGGGPATATAEGRQCFPVRSASSFTALDDQTIHVRVGTNEIYRMELLAPCPNVDWGLTAGLRPRGGGSFVCDALDVDVISPSAPFGPQSCHVRTLRRLSPEEVAALPANQRP